MTRETRVSGDEVVRSTFSESDRAPCENYVRYTGNNDSDMEEKGVLEGGEEKEKTKDTKKRYALDTGNFSKIFLALSNFPS